MKKIVVMAGGTGGHIFPGLSIAKELRDNYGYEVLWIGAKGYMEENIVPKHDIPLKLISIHGLRNKGVLRKFLAPFKILKAILDVSKILKEFNPNVVLGLGGFVSGPGGISAKLLGIPLVLHEQNATAGLTNRLLSKIANKVLLGFPGAIKSGVYVGNPIRKEIVQIHNELPKKFNEKVRISVVGGSLGAQALNKIVPHAFSLLEKECSNIEILHQTGRNNSETVIKEYQSLGVKNFEVSDFIYDMDSLYRTTDIIICRAGAGMVAEVSAAGIPAIFVPLPTAVDDHQTKNALTLSEKNAAICIKQSELDSQKLAKQILELINDKQKLAIYSENAARLSKINAAIDSAKICDEVAK